MKILFNIRYCIPLGIKGTSFLKKNWIIVNFSFLELYILLEKHIVKNLNHYYWFKSELFNLLALKKILKLKFKKLSINN